MPQRVRRRIPSDEELYKPLRDPGVWKAMLFVGALLALAVVGGCLVIRGLT